jgi:predicted nucleotidyltransferase component of viral defense system
VDTTKLRPDTARVWNSIESQPRLKGFVLIGGTAMTLRIGHRVSEDLDFAYGASKLPEVQLKSLCKDLASLGIDMVPNDDPIDVENFHNDGLVLTENQQNYIACTPDGGKVKVSFVVLDQPAGSLVPALVDDPLRVASLDEIFNTKAWVCSQRNKTRDWFDLYTLISSHGYSFEDIYAVYRRIGRLPSFKILDMHLRACKPELSDEGYLQLTQNAPTLDDLRIFFGAGLDELEVLQAKRAFLASRLESR